MYFRRQPLKKPKFPSLHPPTKCPKGPPRGLPPCSYGNKNQIKNGIQAFRTRQNELLPLYIHERMIAPRHGKVYYILVETECAPSRVWPLYPSLRPPPPTKENWPKMGINWTKEEW